MTKTLTTKEGVKLVIETREQNCDSREFFKYEVISYSVATDMVTFKFLNSPRNPVVDNGISLVTCVTPDGTTYYVASSKSPQCHNKICFALGADDSLDGTELSCTSEEFNTYQLMMLVWNISITEHRSKLVYDICTCCGKLNVRKLNITKVKDFALFSHRCNTCVEANPLIRLRFEINGDQYSADRYSNQFFMHVPAWAPFKKNFKKHTSNTIYSHIANIESYATRCNVPLTEIVVETTCTRCGKIHEGAWKDITVQGAYFYDKHLCSDCNALVKACSNCGRSTFSAEVWNEETGDILCDHCVGNNPCYVCRLEMDNNYKRTRSLRNDQVGTTYQLCATHYKAVKNEGWASLRLTPELSYSWKLEPSALKIMTDTCELKPIMEQSVIPLGKTPPVAALEWEFPFSKQGCKTEMRDRAIWEFMNILETSGFKDAFRAKHDGSLPSFATEFVSEHPSTLKAWHAMFNKGVLDSLVKLMDVKYTNDHKDSVGGHIHINRSSFTPVMITKALTFLYSNRSFMEFICRRGFSGSSYYKHQTSIHPLAFAHDFSATSPEKYTLARVTHKKHAKMEFGTIEVRAFKSPTSAVEAIQNIEFMFGLREFVLNFNSVESKRPDAFIDFICGDGKLKFPSLAERLQTREITTFDLNRPSVGSFSNIKRRKFCQPRPASATRKRGTNDYPVRCEQCSTMCGIGHGYYDARHSEWLCEDHSFECPDCGNYDRPDYASYYHNDSAMYCSTCYEREVRYCEDCDNGFRRDDIQQVAGNYVCGGCASYYHACPECGHMCHEDEGPCCSDPCDEDCDDDF